MGSEIKLILMSLLFTTAEQQGYLETHSQHTDAIHKHLSKICFDELILVLVSFFDVLLKKVKRMNLGQVTIAFDETYIPYYGKKWSLWIDAYTNKIKGATGSYKFMVCSVVLGEKRLVLYMLPMHRGQNTYVVLEKMLDHIKKYLRIRLVLCDRGFFSERVINTLEKHDMRYVILTPKNKKIKRFMDAKEIDVTSFLKSTSNFSTNWTQVRYVFAYNIFGYDWAFTTNENQNILALIMTYKGRWGIETTFRVLDFAEIKSKSTNIVVRTFFFMIAIILYNLWLEFKEEITFEKFLDYLALANRPLQDVINGWKKAKKFFNIRPGTEEKEMLAAMS